MSTLAERVRYVRERILSLTQERIASKLRVTRGAVSNWEHGVDEGISAKNLQAISVLAKVSLDWLMTGAGEPPMPRPPSGREIISEYLEILGESHLLTLSTLSSTDFAAAVAEALVRFQSVTKFDHPKIRKKPSHRVSRSVAKKTSSPKQIITILP